MGRAGPRLSRLARVRHHPRRAAATGRPAPRTARPANQTPPTGFATPYPNRHNTNRFRRDRITSPTSGTYIRPHLHRYWDATRALTAASKPDIDAAAAANGTESPIMRELSS